jgi:CheY-like chemotaxis protein
MGRTIRVLIVEDHDDSRDSLQWVLELEGYAVASAPDALRGFALAREFRPDIALIDVGLPDVSGYDLARRLRATPECGKIRLLALTGHARPVDRLRALEAGFDGHFTKPLDPDRLVEILAG